MTSPPPLPPLPTKITQTTHTHTPARLERSAKVRRVPVFDLLFCVQILK